MGLSKLEQQTKYDSIEMISSLDTVMHVKDEDSGIKRADISHEELKRLLSAYIQVSDFKKI